MTQDAFLIMEDQKSMALLLQRELAFLTPSYRLFLYLKKHISTYFA